MASISFSAAPIATRTIGGNVARVFDDLRVVLERVDDVASQPFRKASSSGPSSNAVIEGRLGSAAEALEELTHQVPAGSLWHNHGPQGVQVLKDAQASFARGGIPVRLEDDLRRIQDSTVDMLRGTDGPLGSAATAYQHLQAATVRLPRAIDEGLYAGSGSAPTTSTAGMLRNLAAAKREMTRIAEQLPDRSDTWSTRVSARQGAAQIDGMITNFNHRAVPQNVDGEVAEVKRKLINIIGTA